MKITSNRMFLLLLGMLLIGTPATSFGSDISLEELIITAGNAESAVRDIRIEYTNIVRPYGSKGRDLTAAEQEIVGEYPGKYKQQSGVLTVKGDKIRIERSAYLSKSPTRQGNQVIAYNGQATVCQDSKPNKAKGLVTAGLWHGLRLVFNPWCTITASGDMKFSEELKDMDAKIVPGLQNVNGTSCQVVKLYKKITKKGKDHIVRSYKVYLDPSRNYSLLKVEKYWHDFKGLDSVMEVKGISNVTGDLYIPTKALLVDYSYVTGEPVREHELNVTGIHYDEDVSDSVFTPSFMPGTRVWDSKLKMTYDVPNI